MTNVIGDVLNDADQNLTYENAQLKEISVLSNIDKTKTSQEIIDSIENGVDLGNGVLFKPSDVVSAFSDLEPKPKYQDVGVKIVQEREQKFYKKILSLGLIQGDPLSATESMITESGLIMALYLKTKYVNVYNENSLVKDGQALIDALRNFHSLSAGDTINMTRDAYDSNKLKKGELEIQDDKFISIPIQSSAGKKVNIKMLNMTGRNLVDIKQTGNKIDASVDEIIDDGVSIDIKLFENGAIDTVVGTAETGFKKDFDEKYEVVAIDAETFAITRKGEIRDNLDDKRKIAKSKLNLLLSGLSGLEQTPLSELATLEQTKLDLDAVIENVKELGLDIKSFNNIDRSNDVELMIKMMKIEENIEKLPNEDNIKLADKPAIEALRKEMKTNKVVPRNLDKLIGLESKLNTLQLIEDINLLIKPDQLKLTDTATLDAIAKARQSFDGFEAKYQIQVLNLTDLLALEKQVDLLKLEDIITKLPDIKTIQLTHQDDVSAARLATTDFESKYNTLPSNIEKLEQAELLLDILKVDEMILKLPSLDSLTYQHKTIVDEVTNAAKELEKKNAKPGRIDDLIKYEKKMELLTIENMISTLPKLADMDLGKHEQEVVDARYETDKFIRKEKVKPANIDLLLDAENGIEVLKVEEMIDLLPKQEDMSLDKKHVDPVNEALEAVQQLYKKNLVPRNIENLGKLEKKMNLLLAEDMIKSLPAKSDIKLNNESKIQEARKFVTENELKPTNIQLLDDAETKIKELKEAKAQAEATKKAKFATEELIKALPEPKDLTLDKKHTDAVNLAKKSADELEKNYPGTQLANLDKLNKAIQTIADMEKAKEEKEVAKKSVEEAIEKLPAKTKVELKDKQDIESARKATNELNQKYKLKPKNLKKLTDAEVKIVQLQEVKEKPLSSLNLTDGLYKHEFNSNKAEIMSLKNADWKKVFDANPAFGPRIEKQFNRYKRLLTVSNSAEVKEDLMSKREPYDAAIFQIFAKYKAYQDGSVGKYYLYRVDGDFGPKSEESFDKLFPETSKQKPNKPKNPASKTERKVIGDKKTPQGYEELDPKEVDKKEEQVVGITDIAGISVQDINTDLANYNIEFEEQLENGDLLFNRIGSFFDREPNDIILRPQKDGTYKIMQEGEWFLTNDKDLKVITGIKPKDIVNSVIGYDTLMDEYEQVIDKINDIGIIDIDNRILDYNYLEEYDLQLGSEYYDALLKDLAIYKDNLEDHTDLKKVPKKYHDFVNGKVEGSHTQKLIDKAIRAKNEKYHREAQNDWESLEQDMARDEATIYTHKEYLDILIEANGGVSLEPDCDVIKPQANDEIIDLDLEGWMDESFLIKRDGGYIGVTVASYSDSLFDKSRDVVIWSPVNGKPTKNPVDIIKTLNEVRNDEKKIKAFDNRPRKV